MESWRLNVGLTLAANTSERLSIIGWRRFPQGVIFPEHRSRRVNII